MKLLFTKNTNHKYDGGYVEKVLRDNCVVICNIQTQEFHQECLEIAQ